MNTRSASLLPTAVTGAALLLGACSDGESTDAIRDAVGTLPGTGPGFEPPDDTVPLPMPDAVVPPAVSGPSPPPTTPTTPAEPAEPATPTADGPSERWRLAREGTLRGRYTIGGNDSLVYTLSRELRERGFLTAVSSSTGEELWRVADVAFTTCFPALLGTGDIVVHLDRSTALGGDDNSDDLAIIDGESGELLDTWEPGNAGFDPCTSGGLLVSDGDQVVLNRRGRQYGFTTTDGTLELSWERDWFRDADGDPVAGGRTPSFFDADAIIGKRFYMGGTEPHSDGFDRGVSLYQLDASTGRAAGRLELPLRSLFDIRVAGPGKLLVTGQDKDRGESIAVLVGGAGAADPADSLVIDWTRAAEGNGDGVTGGISSDAIALSDGAFASWSATTAGPTVTEFDLATGLANWSARTSSFSNNDSISALPAGGYAVFPFGGNFVEAFDENGDPAWEIDEVEGGGFSSAMGVYGGTLVMLGATEGGWGFIGIGPLSEPALEP